MQGKGKNPVRGIALPIQSVIVYWLSAAALPSSTQCSGNSRLQSARAPALQSFRHTNRASQSHEQTIQKHHDVLDTIRMGNFDAARQEMENSSGVSRGRKFSRQIVPGAGPVAVANECLKDSTFDRG
ncbi:hypothetical protein AJ87_48655 [Rhizobium yanglingense]|nr:hypothetical protein AJ87_48655 [Rhizobium yanglingense]